ncbi:MAG: hypothetical protein U9Q07_08050 [Planctomycetota bacterium]|nr:hypothetical protein [Planctomycetota bacterium]
MLEINSMASLGGGGAFVLAASKAGYTFESLVSRIIDITHERYFGVPAPAYARTHDKITENWSPTKLPALSP